jgi:P pilus assembly chaperone PapD
MACCRQSCHRRTILLRGKFRYGPRPVTIIEDSGLRHPDSLAFTPETNHLVVTNAGANYFSVYQLKRDDYKVRTNVIRNQLKQLVRFR